MNKVITINLNGNAYQLEEAGYERLREYLDRASTRLSGNPDRDEIVADLEQSIADKCRAVLTSRRTVVTDAEVLAIIAEMGDVDDTGAGAEKDGSAASPPPAGEPRRRLYRLKEGRQLSGVCTGLAAYFNVDVKLIRVAFIFAGLVSAGAAVVAYVIMELTIPAAATSVQHAAARGAPVTAQEVVARAVRRAKEGVTHAARAIHEKPPGRYELFGSRTLTLIVIAAALYFLLRLTYSQWSAIWNYIN